MIGLKRNQRTFYCASYTGLDMPMDGTRTYYLGPSPSYGPPFLLEGAITPATGRASVEVFGENIRYDKTIILYDPAADVQETSVLWLDTVPVLEEDGTTVTPHDYIVTRVARSLNMTVLAVTKVVVSR